VIDWLNLVIVAIAALLAASVIVTLFATGIKLFSVPPPGVELSGSARDDETDDVASSSRPLAATIGGIACFVLTGIGVLFGIYLIVPALHG
jgi:hypothetical protein